MGSNNKKAVFSIEIVYNSFGQIIIKKRFLMFSTTYFFRYILRGL